MIANFIKYLSFLVKSTNQHGVHSPFVYNLLTKCLYKRPRRHYNRTKNLVLKSIPYFNIKHVLWHGHAEFKKEIAACYPHVIFGSPPYDLVLVEELPQINFDFLMEKGEIHNDTVFVITNLFKTNKRDWKQLINTKDITVSIDAFWCGILFIRKEQEKEHFTIRI